MIEPRNFFGEKPCRFYRTVLSEVNLEKKIIVETEKTIGAEGMIKEKRKYSDGELRSLIEDIGRKPLELFGQEAVSGVSSSELLPVLKSVKSGWKDIFRPALAALSCEAVGGSRGATECTGVMFTLTAAGIAIHDDIIDKSLSQGFKVTVVGSHGLEKALLCGDLLIVKSMNIVKEMIRGHIDPWKIATILDIYGNSLVELCEAELAEISFRCRLDIDLQTYLKSLWSKNADLVAVAKTGAILGNGSETEIQALGEYGRRLGFLLGISDDLTDSLNSMGNLAQRIKLESLPLPILYAAKSSKDSRARIEYVLKKPHVTSMDVKEIMQLCFEAEAFDCIRGIARYTMKKGIDSLKNLKATRSQKILVSLIERSFRDVAHKCL